MSEFIKLGELKDVLYEYATDEGDVSKISSYILSDINKLQNKFDDDSLVEVQSTEQGIELKIAKVTNENPDTMKISVNQALNVNGKLQKQRIPGRGVQKPQILNAKGDAGMGVYFLKNAIQDTFKSEFERVQDLLNEKSELQQDQSELQQRKQQNKTGLSKDDKKELKKINKEIKEINDELDEIAQQKKEIELPTGKIPVDGIKNYADADDLETLAFAIDFSQNGEQKEGEQ